MNQTQRGAIYGLLLTAFMLCIPLFDFVESKIHMSMLVKHLVFIPWIILLIIPVWLMERKKTKAPFDERDKQICIHAAIAAVVLLFLASITAYTVILFWFESFTLESRHLPVLIYGSLSAFIFLLSIGVLIQYLPFHNKKEKGSAT